MILRPAKHKSVENTWFLPFKSVKHRIEISLVLHPCSGIYIYIYIYKYILRIHDIYIYI